MNELHYISEGFHCRYSSGEFVSAVCAKTSSGRDCSMATGKWVVICTSVGLLTPLVTVRSMPFTMKVVYKQLRL